jgi:hypothetical protein
LNHEAGGDAVEGEVVVEALFERKANEFAVLGARAVSSAMSKVPQLVSTTAVTFSPFLTVCAGAL